MTDTEEGLAEKVKAYINSIYRKVIGEEQKPDMAKPDTAKQDDEEELTHASW